MFCLGPDESLNFFEEIFPELVESNSVGKLSKSSFNLWESGNNEVTVELDNQPTHNLLGARDVYVGGPAALFSAAIQVGSGIATVKTPTQPQLDITITNVGFDQPTHHQHKLNVINISAITDPI